MTEPQVWTTIGILATAFFGTMALIPTMFTRVLRSEIAGLRGELKSDIAELRGELKGDINGLRVEMVTGFAETHRRIDHLDSDIDTLMKKEFGRGRGGPASV